MGLNDLNLEITEGWEDYELIDSGEGRRLERFGKYILDRPDPQIIWKKSLPPVGWNKADVRYVRTKDDHGNWIKNTKIPDNWSVKIQELDFWVKLSPFKHTGIFPEQVEQWNFISNSINQTYNESVSFLNLFAYTGVASLIAAKAGAKVTHVDASKPAITWANENRELNKMTAAPIRWIIDDAIKFTEREVKRGVAYDAIIMDPPVYGHGPKGEQWDFNRDFPRLLENCRQILSPNPLFVIVNAYAVSTSSVTIANTINDYFGDLGGTVENGELAIKDKSNKILSTGIWAKWESKFSQR